MVLGGFRSFHVLVLTKNSICVDLSGVIMGWSKCKVWSFLLIVFECLTQRPLFPRLCIQESA